MSFDRSGSAASIAEMSDIAEPWPACASGPDPGLDRRRLAGRSTCRQRAGRATDCGGTPGHRGTASADPAACDRSPVSISRGVHVVSRPVHRSNRVDRRMIERHFCRSSHRSPRRAPKDGKRPPRLAAGGPSLGRKRSSRACARKRMEKYRRSPADVPTSRGVAALFCRGIYLMTVTLSSPVC